MILFKLDDNLFSDASEELKKMNQKLKKRLIVIGSLNIVLVI
jgi:hypothetical protein